MSVCLSVTTRAYVRLVRKLPNQLTRKFKAGWDREIRLPDAVL